MKTATAVLAAAAITLGGAGPAAADDAQLWTAVFANGPVKDESRLLLWFDGHARFRDDVGRLGVSIIRPGVGWRLDDKGTAIWAGYARVVSRSAAAPDVEENRFWQQATYQLGAPGGVSLSGRTRLEQRLIEGADDTGIRVRQLIRAEKPISDSKFAALGWNELFIAANDTDWGAASGYDQNRLFVGASWRPAGAVRLEAGYLMNHIRRQNAPDPVNHALALSLAFSL